MKVTNEDLSLVSQVAGLHDKAAFNELVRKYQSPIRRFFLHQTLGDEQLSDDLAQDTFIKAYTNIHQFKGTAATITADSVPPPIRTVRLWLTDAPPTANRE